MTERTATGREKPNRCAARRSRWPWTVLIMFGNTRKSVSITRTYYFLLYWASDGPANPLASTGNFTAALDRKEAQTEKDETRAPARTQAASIKSALKVLDPAISNSPTNQDAPGSSPSQSKQGRVQVTLRALRHRNFQLFFSGQLISLIGSWMQTVAQSWLVYRMTG